MRNVRLRLCVLSSLIFLSAPFVPRLRAQAQQADRVLVSAASSPRVVLAGHRAPWQTAASDRGALPDAQPVQLIFGISRAPEVQAAFEQLLADQQNPSSARYHQWLTPQQVGEQFGPTQHDLDALTQWLTGQGLQVDGIEPSRVFVHVSAPAGLIAAALGTSLHRYSVSLIAGGTETRQAPTAEPSLPASLAPIVGFIGGLSSVPMHLHSHVQVMSAPAAPAAPGTGIVRPDLTANANNTAHYLTPLDFNKIYDIGSGFQGTNQKVMIIGGSRLNPPDLSYFESDTALAAYTPNYVVGPSFTDPGQTNDDNMGEGTLDFERVYGTAPSATVDQVIALNWLNGTVNANLQLYAINSVNDPVMSLSFGACEAEQSASYVRQEDSVYSQAAAQGISVFASSGDSGVTGCAVHGSAASTSTQQVSISDICASSYVTCVGGTQFNDTSSPSTYWSATNSTGFLSALGYIPEAGWNEPSYVDSSGVTHYVVAASTGGPSTVIAKPVWQTGTGVPADGVRDTPDISFSGSGHDGYFSCLAYAGGSCVPNAQGAIGFVAFSGTSASAPSMAGIAALIDQKLGARQGNMNPSLYRLFTSTPAAFHDATIASSGVSGCAAATPSPCNNSTPGPASLTTGAIPGYLLATGYDLVTGLGSLDVGAYLSAISTPTLITTTTSLSASPATITSAGTVKFTAVIAPATGTVVPTGNVVFTSNGGPLATVPLTAGSASTAALSFAAAGTYLITASYSGDTVNATSGASISFIVTAPTLPATSTVLTGTTGTITAQTGASYSATVTSTATGTPTGTVQFLKTTTAGVTSNLGAPANLSASATAAIGPVNLPVGTYTVSAVYSGSTSFAGSTSNTLAVTSTAVPTTTTLSGVPSTTLSTQANVVTATVTSTGAGTATGTVQFTVDAVNAGAAVVLNGTAMASTSLTFAAGTHKVCAVYSGDTTFASSTSVCQNVVSSGVTVMLTPASATLTAASGTTVTDAITITSTNFSGTQNLSCAVTFNGPGTAVNVPVCSFSPTSAVFTGTGTASATITITSLKNSAVSGGNSASLQPRTLAGLGGAALCSLLVLCLPRRRRNLRALRLFSAFVFLAATLATLAGCGSGGGSTAPHVIGTTVGSYNVLINSSSNLNGANNVGYSGTVLLTIQ